MVSNKTKKDKVKKTKVKKQGGKLMASDPSSLKGVYAELEAANFSAKQEAALKAIFAALSED